MARLTISDGASRTFPGFASIAPPPSVAVKTDSCRWRGSITKEERQRRSPLVSWLLRAVRPPDAGLASDCGSLPSYGMPTYGPVLSLSLLTANQLMPAPRCSLKPKGKSCARPAARHSPTMSLRGPMLAEFQRLCGESKLSKLSWCMAWPTKYLPPAGRRQS